MPVILGLLASLASPLLLKYFPAHGPAMAFAALGVSVLMALILGAMSGDFSHLDAVKTPEMLMTLLAALYAIQQLSYSALKDRLHL